MFKNEVIGKKEDKLAVRKYSSIINNLVEILHQINRKPYKLLSLKQNKFVHCFGCKSDVYQRI